MHIKIRDMAFVGSTLRFPGDVVEATDDEGAYLVSIGRAETIDPGEKPAEGGEGGDDEAMRAELSKLTNAQLHELAGKEEIEVGAGDNKTTLVETIIAGRKAKTETIDPGEKPAEALD